MWNWRKYLCCCTNYYHEYKMRRVREIYVECFTEDKNKFDPINLERVSIY